MRRVLVPTMRNFVWLEMLEDFFQVGLRRQGPCQWLQHSILPAGVQSGGKAIGFARTVNDLHDLAVVISQVQTKTVRNPGRQRAKSFGVGRSERSCLDFLKKLVSHSLIMNNFLDSLNSLYGGTIFSIKHRPFMTSVIGQGAETHKALSQSERTVPLLQSDREAGFSA